METNSVNVLHPTFVIWLNLSKCFVFLTKLIALNVLLFFLFVHQVYQVYIFSWCVFFYSIKFIVLELKLEFELDCNVFIGQNVKEYQNLMNQLSHILYVSSWLIFINYLHFFFFSSSFYLTNHLDHFDIDLYFASLYARIIWCIVYIVYWWIAH